MKKHFAALLPALFWTPAAFAQEAQERGIDTAINEAMSGPQDGNTWPDGRSILWGPK